MVHAHDVIPVRVLRVFALLVIIHAVHLSRLIRSVEQRRHLRAHRVDPAGGNDVARERLTHRIAAGVIGEVKGIVDGDGRSGGVSKFGEIAVTHFRLGVRSG